MNIERKTFAEQHYIYVDRVATFSPADISAATASSFSEVFGFAAAKSIKPHAGPMSVYLERPTNDKMAFRAGVFVDAEDAKLAEGSIKSGVMTAREAFTTTHVGPYASLSRTHKALWDHMEAQGVSKSVRFGKSTSTIQQARQRPHCGPRFIGRQAIESAHRRETQARDDGPLRRS